MAHIEYTYMTDQINRLAMHCWAIRTRVRTLTLSSSSLPNFVNKSKYNIKHSKVREVLVCSLLFTGIYICF